MRTIHRRPAGAVVYDITPPPGLQEGVSAGGWGHPVCSAEAKAIAATLPVIEP